MLNRFSEKQTVRKMRKSSIRSQKMLKLTSDDQKKLIYLVRVDVSSWLQSDDFPFQLRDYWSREKKESLSFHEIFRSQRHLVAIRFSKWSAQKSFSDTLLTLSHFSNGLFFCDLKDFHESAHSLKYSAPVSWCPSWTAEINFRKVFLFRDFTWDQSIKWRKKKTSSVSLSMWSFTN